MENRIAVNERLQEDVCELDRAAHWAGPEITVDKTKTMIFEEETTDMEITAQEDEIIENVTEFVNLDSLLTWINNWTKEIKRRIEKAKGLRE